MDVENTGNQAEIEIKAPSEVGKEPIGARSKSAKKRLSFRDKAILAASLGLTLATGGVGLVRAEDPTGNPIQPDARPWVDLGENLGPLVTPKEGLFVPGARGPVGNAAADAYWASVAAEQRAEGAADRMGRSRPLQDASRTSHSVGQAIDKWVYDQTGGRLPMIGPQGGVHIPEGPPPGSQPRRRR
jgi:hypothetical protein